MAFLEQNEVDRGTMNGRNTSRFFRRLWAKAALFCLVAFGTPLRSFAGNVRTQAAQAPAPIERRAPPSNYRLPATPPTGRAAGRNAGPERTPAHGPHGEHLAQWMSQHSALSPDQQQQALGHEPGFEALAPDTQQRMRQRLLQLDAMSPERRQRLLARNEAMERLTPNQRAEVRGALGQLGSLPPEQRHAVAHTFRALRDLPAEQRLQAYNSGRFGPPLNDAQRSILLNLLRVEPMLPPPGSPVQAVRPAIPYGMPSQ